ncbi:MAG: YlxR family protein [Gaiellaceae bacterium]
MSAPIRTCVGCGRKRPQAELLRFVAPQGLLTLDALRQATGRGAYTCPRIACLERATARQAFARTLRRRVTVRRPLDRFLKEH